MSITLPYLLAGFGLVDNASVPAGGPFTVSLPDRRPFIFFPLVDNASVTVGGPFMFCSTLLDVTADVLLQVGAVDVLNSGGQPACCSFFFLCDKLVLSYIIKIPLATPLCGSRSVGFGNADEKEQRCWCYEWCFFWPADVATAAVLLRPCCRSCATLTMYVSLLRARGGQRACCFFM